MGAFQGSDAYRPSLLYLRSRLDVDVISGRVFWIDATRNHENLNGKEAGCPRNPNNGKKCYWHIKVDSYPIKRAHIVFLFSTGRWPHPLIDHINGDSLDDRIENLREATHSQNAWNRKSRAVGRDTPMGVRKMPSGRFQARISCHKKHIVIGVFETCELAEMAYQCKRKELFNEFA